MTKERVTIPPSSKRGCIHCSPTRSTIHLTTTSAVVIVCGLYRQGCRQDKNSSSKRQRRVAAAHTHRHDVWGRVEDPPQEAPPLQPLCLGVDNFPSLHCYLHFLCILPYRTHTEPQRLCLCIPGMLPAGLCTMAGIPPCLPLPRGTPAPPTNVMSLLPPGGLVSCTDETHGQEYAYAERFLALQCATPGVLCHLVP